MTAKVGKKLDRDGSSGIGLADSGAVYTHADISDNTRNAYQDDIKQFLAQGYSLPATIAQLQHYLKECATIHNPGWLKSGIHMFK